jgi:hypothetical protein
VCWRQQLKKVMARRGFCWQRVMAGVNFFTKNVKITDVLAKCYGKKGCHHKMMAIGAF